MSTFDTFTLHFTETAALTSISNAFIDRYLPIAHGDFIKTYLYLQRLLQDPSTPSKDLKASCLADALNTTENDIHRALRYWEKEGVFTVSIATNKPVTTKAQENVKQTIPVGDIEKEAPGAIVPLHEHLGAKALTTDEKKAQEEIARRTTYSLSIAEQYFGRPLSPGETDAILYLIDVLGMDEDFIDYILGSLVDAGKTTAHDIKTLAFEFSSKGIHTAKEAIAYGTKYKVLMERIAKAMGVRFTQANKTELDFLKKWVEEYHFSKDMIEKAAQITNNNASEPSFQYANSILVSWREQSITTLDEVEALEQKRKKNYNRNQGSGTGQADVSNTRTASKQAKDNYERRIGYDWDAQVAQTIQDMVKAL